MPRRLDRRIPRGPGHGWLLSALPYCRPGWIDGWACMHSHTVALSDRHPLWAGPGAACLQRLPTLCWVGASIRQGFGTPPPPCSASLPALGSHRGSCHSLPFVQYHWAACSWGAGPDQAGALVEGNVDAPGPHSWRATVLIPPDALDGGFNTCRGSAMPCRAEADLPRCHPLPRYRHPHLLLRSLQYLLHRPADTAASARRLAFELNGAPGSSWQEVVAPASASHSGQVAAYHLHGLQPAGGPARPGMRP